MAMFPPIVKGDNQATPPFNPVFPGGFAGGPNPARKRQNAKRDERRKEGAQALRVAKGAAVPPPQPAPSAAGSYDLGALKQLWLQAGGPPEAADTMAHVMYAESAGNPRAHNSYVENGKQYNVDGLAQISDIHGPGNYTDPLTGVRKAVELYKAQGLKPWEDSRNKGAGGGWGQYIGAAAPSAPSGPPGPGMAAPGAPPVAPPVPPQGIGKNTPLDRPPQYVPPSGPPPQLGAPMGPDGKPMAAPQATSPTFTPAKYEPPKKGLEYLALAAGLLFPGAPIARIAAGFAGGLAQGAQSKYQRAENVAEQQYKAARDTAQTEYQNAVQRYGVASDEAKLAYVNAQALRGEDEKKAAAAYDNAVVRYNADKDTRARGIDPKTQKPFVVPPALAHPKPNGTASDYAQYESGLAQFYTSVGATDLAAQHATAAKDYNKQVHDAHTEAVGLWRTLYTVQHEDSRAANAAQRTYDAGARSDRNHADTLQHQTDVERDRYRTDAYRLSHAFDTNWAKAITEQDTYDANGAVTGVKKPAAINDPATKQALTKAFMLIKRSSEADPQGLAQHLSDGFDDSPRGATAKALLNDLGAAQEALRRSRRLPILARPDEYYQALDKAQQATALKHAGLNLKDPRVKAAVEKATKLGLDLNDPETLKAIKAELTPVKAAPAPPSGLGRNEGYPTPM